MIHLLLFLSIIPLTEQYMSSAFTSSAMSSRSQMQAMPVLVADMSSIKTKLFIEEISKSLRRQLIEHSNVDDYHEDKSRNILELYPNDIFQRIDSTSAASPFNNNKRFIHIASEDQTTSNQYIQSISKSDYAFCIPSVVSEDKMKCNHLVQNIADLITQIQSAGSSDLYPLPRQNVNLDAGQWSHFISLTYPSIDDALPHLSELLLGIDAIELRVDLLKDQSIASIHRQIGLLRSVTKLPIVFTVRSTGQIGKFPEDPKAMFALLREGLRAGAEWIDVEACWSEDYIKTLCQLAINEYSSTSSLLGSLHVTTPQSEEQIKTLFKDSSLFGYADILKVVTGAANEDDCQRIHTIGATLNKPYIGVCLGEKGSLSRVLNKRFTPVTHPLMAVAAPGQLSVKQLMAQRIERQLITPKHYYLFGTPIKQSLSPLMHNSAFKTLLMPHEYFLNEQDHVEAYAPLLHSVTSAATAASTSTTAGTSTTATTAATAMSGEHYGGSSVTIPHKESIMSYLSETRSPVHAIGAVNTIAAEHNYDTPSHSNNSNSNSNISNKKGRLIGYNTDWLGIRNPIMKKLARTIGEPWSTAMGQCKSGLVIGAGGTAKAACYAIQQLGLSVIITNRDEIKGRALATQFNGTFVSMNNLTEVTPTVVISTVPGAANFVLPESMISHMNERKLRPVIMDVVYKPARTALLQQAIDNGYECVQGGSMLVEQGVQQFHIWHQRRAPYNVMKQAVFRDIETLDD